MNQDIKLTQFSRGAGCGCKIAPAVLEEILASSRQGAEQRLLVGNNGNDDAAIYDLGNGNALVITADFFMPVVDDAFVFGKTAAANAISDVYAMGGKPVTAIALLGWPIDKIPASVAARVMEGAKEVCKQAGIVISGGHTIDAVEPFFGLSVNGMVSTDHIKQNSTARAGDHIYLTKPIGLGILATAHKRGVITGEHEQLLFDQLTRLNTIGEVLGSQESVTAMTDVTGFGLLGHLTEMCEGSGLSASVQYNLIPKFSEAVSYSKQGIVPDATYRNWNAYGHKADIASSIDAMESFTLLPDPQTNGGLLVAVDPQHAANIQQVLDKDQLFIRIGAFEKKREKTIYIE